MDQKGDVFVFGTGFWGGWIYKLLDKSDLPVKAFIDNNPEYQKKLSARQMLEAVQNEFEDGYLESWDLPAQVRKSDSPACLRYLSEKTYLEYEKLGDTLIGKNPNQAYLCYENAAFLASDAAEKKRLKEKKDALVQKQPVSVRKACILILSYNQKYMTEKCLESIRDNCDPETHSIVILDNASTDGSAQWLSEYVKKHGDQDADCEITLALSDENLGFPAGCNAASEYASPEEDIFLLNNDTRLPANALFWLRMGLYESEAVGAVGAVQNYDANKDQHDDVERSLPEDYLEYGAQHNVYMEDPYVEKNKLSGFAMLIKHGLYHELGGFDERFSPGYFEDDDLCVRIRECGKKLLICRNAFIYHAGSQSFAKRPEAEKLVETNRRKFIEKWGYDIR
jgi:GT2 family glycosyltransferase